MKLIDARNEYFGHSGRASSVSRQLCFAGIATVWVFVVSSQDGSYTIARSFFYALIIFGLALGFDLLQYTWASAVWGIFHRHKEKTLKNCEDTEFLAPAWINWPSIFFFWSKIILSILGYAVLLFSAYGFIKIS